MKLTRSVVMMAVLAVGLSTGFSVRSLAAGVALQQDRDHDGDRDRDRDRYSNRDNAQDIRSVVDRTQRDLREASGLQRGDHEKERYQNAQHSLSTFDRHLVKSHFDKDELDKAIGDIQSILDHNDLEGRTRDYLTSDVRDLRQARQQRR